MVKLSYLLELRVVFLLMRFVGLLPNLNSCLSIIDHHVVPKVERPAAHTHKVRPVKSLLKEFPHSSILGSPNFSPVLLICLFSLVLVTLIICRSPFHHTLLLNSSVLFHETFFILLSFPLLAGLYSLIVEMLFVVLLDVSKSVVLR